MLMKFFYCFFLLTYCVSYSISQQNQGIISGVLKDSLTNIPIEYVSVKLLLSKDSSLQYAMYSSVEGEFLFEHVKDGNYLLKITHLSYLDKWISPIFINTSLHNRLIGQVYLSNIKSTELKEVTISANKSLLMASFDKKVFSVADDISARGGSVNDVLSSIPSVEVDQEGRVTLRGDGNVTILIDGRPSLMSGSSSKSMLDAIPANLIDRIEVVTNPSAKYDPDGTSGIINIILKKNKLRGINGNVSSNVASGNIFNSSTSLSIRNARMNVYGTYSYRHYEGERNNFGQMNRFFGDTLFSLKQDRKGTDYNVGNTIKAGSDFYLKDRNTLGISVTAGQGERNRYGDLVNQQLDKEGLVLNRWTRNSLDPSEQLNFDANLNYKLDFKEDKGSFIFDASQSFSTDLVGGEYVQKYEGKKDLSQKLLSNEKNSVSLVSFDFIQVLPKSIRVEVGLKTIQRNSMVDSGSETKDSISSIFNKDTLSSFKYTYDEQIYSSYGNFAQQFNKFKYQLGARLEKSFQVPSLLSQLTSYPKSYFNIFPSAFLTYSFVKNIDLILNYSKRINRPSAETLNPFTSYADPYNLRRGNPEVSPEFIDSYELGLGIIKNKFSLNASVFYKNTINVLQRYRKYYDNGYAAVTYINIDRSESIGSEISINFRPVPSFKNVFSFSGNQIKYHDNEVVFKNNSGFNWSVKYIGTFEFWNKTASIQINTKYNAPIVTMQGTVQPRASLDLSSEKLIKDGKWSFGVKISDIFNSQEFRIHVDQETVNQTSTFKQTTRRLYVNINYKFGKLEVSKKGKITNDANSGGGDF